MTKSKQKGNPKFQFLFGGEYNDYYMYRVNSEQALLKQQQMGNAQNSTIQSPSAMPSLMSGYQQSHAWNNPPATNSQPNQQPSLAVSAQIDAILMQQNTLKDQIRQSEQNLQAQHSVK